MNIFAELENDWHRAASHLHRHDGDHPAAACHHTQGGTMDLIATLNSLKEHVENAQQWLIEGAEQHIPALITGVQALASTQTGKAVLEIGEALLPPETDAAIAALIRAAVKEAGSLPHPAPADGGSGTPAPDGGPAAPAEGEQPAEPQPAAG